MPTLSTNAPSRDDRHMGLMSRPLSLSVREGAGDLRFFLVHVRDPQFYALPATARAANGNVVVMGFRRSGPPFSTWARR